MTHTRMDNAQPPALAELPISRLNAQGCLDHCNTAYLTLCGYDLAALQGKPHHMIDHPQMPEAVMQRMWATLHAGVAWTAPVMGQHRDGSTFWSELYILPLLAEGKIIGFGTVYHPISEALRRRAEVLYSRLSRGLAPQSMGERIGRHLATHLFAWLSGLGLLGLFATGQVNGLIAGALLGCGSLALAQPALSARLQQRRALAGHASIYSDPLLSSLHGRADGLTARLEMSLHTQQLRMRTVMARIQINGETLRRRTDESAQLVDAQTNQLERQLLEAEQSAAAVNQMSATILELSTNLQQSAQASQEVNRLAHAGDRLSAQSRESMGALGASVQNIGTAVGKLAQSIDSIGGIAQEIRSIAEQTNLLALNAAIEAARAGETGRGFAVVADEVRSLASRTRESTDQIQSRIDELRQSSAEALATTQSGEQAAQRSRDDVEKVQSSLQHICQEIGQVSSTSLQMATAIDQQGQVAEEINRQINQIALFAQDNTLQAKRSGQIGRELNQLASSQLELAGRFLNG